AWARCSRPPSSSRSSPHCGRPTGPPTPTGVAAGTWLLVLGELSCWTIFGLYQGDLRLLTLGVTGVTASALMLARIRHTRRHQPLKSPTRKLLRTGLPPGPAKKGPRGEVRVRRRTWWRRSRRGHAARTRTCRPPAARSLLRPRPRRQRRRTRRPLTPGRRRRRRARRPRAPLGGPGR